MEGALSCDEWDIDTSATPDLGESLPHQLSAHSEWGGCDVFGGCAVTLLTHDFYYIWPNYRNQSMGSDDIEQFHGHYHSESSIYRLLLGSISYYDGGHPNQNSEPI